MKTAVYKARLLGSNGTPHGDAAVKVSTAVQLAPEEHVKGFGYYSHTNEACRLCNAANMAVQLQEGNAQMPRDDGSTAVGSTSKEPAGAAAGSGRLAAIAQATAKVAVPAFLTAGARHCVQPREAGRHPSAACTQGLARLRSRGLYPCR